METVKIDVVDTVQELESTVGNIGLQMETLSDIEVKFSQVVDDMNTAVYNGTEKDYYHEHHRELRMLVALLRYSFEELDGNFADLTKQKSGLFQEIVKKSK